MLAGRSRELRRFESALLNAPDIPANVRLTGLRGVGKTVLLAEFATSAQDLGWRTANNGVLERHNSETEFSRAIETLATSVENRVSRAQRVKGATRRLFKSAPKVEVSYSDIRLAIELALGESAGTLPDTLIRVTSKVVNAGWGGFALMLDEAQILRDSNATGEHPLSQLLASVSTLQRQGLPLGLVLCGLPTLAANLLGARTYSERMFRGEEIGRLKTDEAEEAFVGPLEGQSVTADAQVVSKVLEDVDGYPYFIQLWGAELWEALRDSGSDRMTPDLLDATRSDIYRRLDLDFYEPRVASLRPAEQDILMVSASCSYPPLRVADLNTRTSKKPGNVNVLVGRLNEAGVIYRLRKGEYEYTAPQFHQYLKRRAGQIPYDDASLPF